MGGKLPMKHIQSRKVQKFTYNERGNKYNKSKNFCGDKSQKSLKSSELGERVKKNNKIIFGKGGNSVLPLHSQTANKRTECTSMGIKFR